MARDLGAPDLILTNGQIVTACGDKVVEAMAVSGSRVCAVGRDDNVSSLAGPRTERVDLDGRTVVPGINDSHMHIGYFGTHNPWRGQPERLVAQYRQNDFADMLDQPAYPYGVQALESTLPTRLHPREALAQYFAAASHIDEAMGRLLDELEALQLREQALVVFTSDHGLCCGHHGLWGKGNATLPLNMLEESIRVPLIINCPQALFAGQRRTEFVDHLDIFQTIAEYAGLLDKLDAGRKYPGRSFLPLLDNSAALPDWRRIQFGEYGDLRMARTRRYKLLRRYYSNAPCELFDLSVDPTESQNRYDDPAYQPIVERLSGELDNYFDRYQDADKSGLRVRELPRHNLSEAWRPT